MAHESYRNKVIDALYNGEISLDQAVSMIGKYAAKQEPDLIGALLELKP